LHAGASLLLEIKPGSEAVEKQRAQPLFARKERRLAMNRKNLEKIYVTEIKIVSLLLC
jgi:hypothetical protein